MLSDSSTGSNPASRIIFLFAREGNNLQKWNPYGSSPGSSRDRQKAQPERA
jgi:hypothetical protein